DIRTALEAVVNDPADHSANPTSAPADLEAGWFVDLGVDGLLTGWALASLVSSDQAFWDSQTASAPMAQNAARIQELFSYGLANASNPDREDLIAEYNYTEFILDPELHLVEGY